MTSRIDVPPIHPDEIGRLSNSLNVDPIVAQILWLRGVRDRMTYDRLVSPDEKLPDPYRLPDMGRAVRVVRDAIRNHRKIRVYGDYDADGVTATAIMVRGLNGLADPSLVDWEIPNRFDEGYGLHDEAVLRARDEGIDLLLTVDCGSSSPGAAQLAKEHGVQLVITDHHALPSIAPDAEALVNPQRMSQPDLLSGAGVALELMRALLGGDPPDDLWGIAAIGTVADVVPLTGNNRVIVRRGMTALRSGAVPGVNVLCEAEGRNLERLNAQDLGFFIGPRLNAAGRMGEALAAVQVLLANAPVDATEAVQHVQKANGDRRQIESQVLREAWDQIGMRWDGHLPGFVVIGDQGWHEGVVGIVASRLKDALRRPVAVVSWSQTQGKGSARGVDGWNLIDHLRRHEDRFLRLGGHAGAAGFSLGHQSLEDLSHQLSNGLPKVLKTYQRSGIAVDVRVTPDSLTPKVLSELQQLEPYGRGFERPRFWVSASIKSWQSVGKAGDHLRLGFEGSPIGGIAFGAGALSQSMTTGMPVALVAEMEWKYYRGQESPNWLVQAVLGVAPTVPWENVTDILAGHPSYGMDDKVIIVVDNPHQGNQLVRQLGSVAMFYNSRGAVGDCRAIEAACRVGKVTRLVVSQWRIWPQLPEWADLIVWQTTPRHPQVLGQCAALLAPGGRQWVPGPVQAEYITVKRNRLRPDRKKLGASWRQWQKGAMGLQVGREIFRELNLHPNGSNQRQSLAKSFSYLMARYQEMLETQSWQSSKMDEWKQNRKDDRLWPGQTI